MERSNYGLTLILTMATEPLDINDRALYSLLSAQ